MDDNGALLVALTDIQILRAELASANARCAELEGQCVCLPPPATEGPQEDCPVHGRPYSEWVERATARRATLDRVTAEVTKLADEMAANDCGCTGCTDCTNEFWLLPRLRAALTPEGTE